MSDQPTDLSPLGRSAEEVEQESQNRVNPGTPAETLRPAPGAVVPAPGVVGSGTGVTGEAFGGSGLLAEPLLPSRPEHEHDHEHEPS